MVVQTKPFPAATVKAMEQLQEEHPATLTPPLSSARKVVFVVPVFDEAPRRLLTLLESLANHTVAPGTIEVILVVNNRPTDNSTEWKGAFERNQSVLNLPIYQNRQPTQQMDNTAQLSQIRENLTVYAIDHSSPAHWVEDSNVGRARQNGLNEAALLFYRSHRSGLIVHTDADCRFDDPLFTAKILWLFREDPTMVGMAGINIQELEMNDPEAEALVDNLPAYLLYRRYRSLFKSVRAGKVDFDPEKTLGRCIIHRAFAGVMAGGIAPISLAEDLDFGDKLKVYANLHDMHFAYGRRWNLGPVSALRVSDRTPNSIRQAFLQRTDTGGQAYVEDAFHPDKTVLLNEEYLEKMMDVVRDLPGGPAQLEYLFVTSPLANIRIRRP